MNGESVAEPRILPIRLDVQLPGDHLCMVIAQPLLNLQQTDRGFRIDRSTRGTHVMIVESVLRLACELGFQKDSRGTNFILFPELSLPHDMILKTKDKISDSSLANSILIGGIEGIGLQEYYKILEESNNPEEANYRFSGIANYVNCAAIFVKANQRDEAQLYLQPKIKPSRREEAIEMQRGRHVFVFNSPKLNFLCLVCFDAIYTDSALTSLVSKIMEKLRKMSADKQIDDRLDIVFMLMHNEDPYYEGFQTSAYQLLNGGGRELRSDHGAVVFINSASSEEGSSDKFGKSAFYFRKAAWYTPPREEYPPPSTYCMEEAECDCQRARFREDGPCLHSFSYIPYTAELHISRGKYYPFQDVAWHRMKSDGAIDSPQSVPAIRKIVSDNLPSNLAVEDRWCKAPNGSSLAIKMRQNYEDIREKLVTTTPERTKEITDLLLLGHYPQDNRIENPDYWKPDEEGKAIKELASTLSILALIGEMTLDLPSRVVTGLSQGGFYAVVIDGKHCEIPIALHNSYEDYMAKNPHINIDLERNVLLVLCRHRRDPPSNGIAEEIRTISSILRSEESQLSEELRDENRFLSTTGGRLFWHSHESLQDILDQTDLQAAKSMLEKKLGSLTN